MFTTILGDDPLPFFDTIHILSILTTQRGSCARIHSLTGRLGMCAACSRVTAAETPSFRAGYCREALWRHSIQGRLRKRQQRRRPGTPGREGCIVTGERAFTRITALLSIEQRYTRHPASSGQPEGGGCLHLPHPLLEAGAVLLHDHYHQRHPD